MKLDLKAWLLSVFFITVFSNGLLCPSEAFAHHPSTSFLEITSNEELHISWDISARDLEFAIGLDADGDGTITWGEVNSNRDAVIKYLKSNLLFGASNNDCAWGSEELMVNMLSDGGYIRLNAVLSCTNGLPPFFVYKLFQTIDANHRGLAIIKNSQGTFNRVLVPGSEEISLNSAPLSFFVTVYDYILSGMEHIWKGYDHLLFLFALLLPSVLRRKNNHWEAGRSLKESLSNILKVVTSFTVAHSLTLAAAALSYVTLPTRVTESAIAISVVIAALNNIFRWFGEGTWKVAFLFGLIHGFGFASVLRDSGLSKNFLLPSLLSFNIGVEVGQLTIMIIVVPTLILAARARFYRVYFMPITSFFIASVAMIWVIERAANISFGLPF